MSPASRTSKVLALSVGQSLALVVSLLSGVVLARFLTPQDLGTYRQAFLAYNFAAPLLTLALPQALYFFLPQYAENERSVLVTNLLMLTAMGAVFSLALGFGGTKLLAVRFNNPELEPVLKAFVIYPLLMFPAGAIGACLVAKGRVTALTIYAFLSQVAVALGTIAACIFSPDPKSLITVSVAVAVCTACPALLLMFRSCKTGPWRADPRLAWAMLKYTVPLGLASMLGTLTLQMAGVTVSALRSPDEYAIFSVGAIEIPLIGIVTGSISTVVLADMARLCQAGDRTAALTLFKTAAIRSAVILMPAMMFFFVAARPFIEGLYSPQYSESVLVFQLYLLLLPVRIVYYGPALMALGRTRQVLWRSIGDFAISAALCVIFVQWFGFMGAVFALILTLFFWTVPFNLFCIAGGFGVRVRDVLPLKELGGITLLCLFPAMLANAWRFAPDLPRLGQFGVAFLIYAPLCSTLLLRSGHLPAGMLESLPFLGDVLRARRDRHVVKP